MSSAFVQKFFCHQSANPCDKISFSQFQCDAQQKKTSDVIRMQQHPLPIGHTKDCQRQTTHTKKASLKYNQPCDNSFYESQLKL